MNHLCAGGILYKRRNDIEFLVIKQRRWNGEVQWVASKGHFESGETAAEAALREVAEETGLTQIEKVALLGDQTYHYTEKGQPHEKTVTWHLMRVSPGGKPAPNKKEGFVGAEWLSYEAAKERFTHNAFIEWLDRAYRLIQETE